MEFALHYPDQTDPHNNGSDERRESARTDTRILGQVVACDGSRVTISCVSAAGDTSLSEAWSVGRLISITVGSNRVVALVASMNAGQEVWAEHGENVVVVNAELLGEVYETPDGKERFSTGISTYPYMGAPAHRIRSSDLTRIYDSGKTDTASVGKLSQDASIDATIHIPSMLSRHFAIVGSTGVGKSTAVSLLLRKAVESDPKLRVIILDPHNEFSAAFPGMSVDIDTDKLDLPFWLFRLEEFSEVIFRGRPAVPTELDVLRDLIPEAKKGFRGVDTGVMRRAADRSSITADTPVPYRMSDLLALIDERIGRLDGREEKPFLRSLKVRIMAAINDPRYKFMFSSNTITDTISETIAHIFRIPGDGKPISIFQLAGIPSEVVNSVASVLCRMAFEIGLWSNGAIHMLVVCEEAHRYVPASSELGFFPTRQAIARIAKEGRKYGVSLGIVTQRPGELDQTILSQCSTVFAMRLSNDNDQDIIRKAIPQSSMSTINFISSIGNGEAIAFGEALAVPMRLKFNRLEEVYIPKAAGTITNEDDFGDTVQISEIVERMRAVAGPDISAFQAAFPPIPAGFDAIPATPGLSAFSEPDQANEPYQPGNAGDPGRTGMTPPPIAPNAYGDDAARMARSLRETQRTMAARPSDIPAPDRTSDDSQQRPSGSSLRESLFKKPPGGGGLFRR